MSRSIALVVVLLAGAAEGGSGTETPAVDAAAAAAAYQEAVERYNAYGLAQHTFADEKAKTLARAKEAAWARLMQLGGPQAAARARRPRPLPIPPLTPRDGALPPEPPPLPPVWPARALLAVGLLATAAAGGLAWPLVSRRIIRCPGCKRRLRVPRWRKAKVRCPDCRAETRV